MALCVTNAWPSSPPYAMEITLNGKPAMLRRNTNSPEKEADSYSKCITYCEC